MTPVLLTRDDFREEVFARDKHTCVHCGQPGVDAHHILERRLFPDGGYYLSNGVTLCGGCHLDAESTGLDCDTLRLDAGITRPVRISKKREPTTSGATLSFQTDSVSWGNSSSKKESNEP